MSFEPELVGGILEHFDESISALVEPPTRDISTVKREYVEIVCNAGSANLNNATALEFDQTSRANYYQYQDSYLFGTFRIFDDANNPINDTALTGGAATLFSKAEFLIDNQEIESKEHPGIGSLMLKLIEASEDHIKTTASGSLVYPDEGNGGVSASYVAGIGAAAAPAASAIVPASNAVADVRDAVRLAEDNATAYAQAQIDALADRINAIAGVNPNYNGGWVKKLARCQGVVAFFLPMRDLFGWARDTKRVMVGQPVKLRLTRQSLWDEVLMTPHGGSATAKVVFESLSWFVPQLKPSSKAETEVMKLMAQGHESIDLFREWKMYRQPVGVQANIAWLVRNSGRGRATRVITAFQRADQLARIAANTGGADSSGNGATFDNAGIIRFRVKLDEQQFPQIDFTPDFPNNKYHREYAEMLRAGCKDPSTSLCQVGSVISYEAFRQLYPFMCVDVSRKDDSVFSEITDGALRVEADITPGAVNRTMWVLVETERRVVYKGDGAGKSWVVRV